ncbi:MAG: DUF2169 domain-containing protein [Deltaproteobacteria bacterium]|nr:DUF2169 domain-containing protein [Deltaproteobacteria bacterium]
MRHHDGLDAGTIASPVRLVRDTPFEVGWIVWSVRPPRPSLTLVVKGTFDLRDGRDCELASEQRPCTGDLFYDDDTEQSVRYESDFAILKQRAECFLVGTCHPPGGSATTSAVAFGVGNVKKALAVYGDRVWATTFMGRTQSPPAPFTSMPLRWERCYGGPDLPANPLGAGRTDIETHDGTERRLPNLEDPTRPIVTYDDAPEPIGFFPIPRAWARRGGRTGTYDARWRETRWPFFPEDFDWRYFNGAPLDQQIDGFWRGDETIALTHLRPGQRNVQSKLPGIRARAFLDAARDPSTRDLTEVALNLDTITVDADAAQVVCLWRGLVEVQTESLSEIERLFVVHERFGARSTVADHGLRLQAILDAEKAEDAAMRAEPPPPAAAAASDGAPGTEPTVEPPAEPEEVGELRAKLKELGIDMDAELAKEAPGAIAAMTTAEMREDLRRRFVAAELEVPPELDDLRDDAPDSGAPADAEGHDLRLEVQAAVARGESLEGRDLTGADLHALDLGGVNLARAILVNANLRGATLDRANLDGAVLHGADLKRASLKEVSAKKADFTEIVAGSVELDGATLDDAVLSRAQLTRVKIRRASCVGALFDGAIMNGADLGGTRLDRADLSRAELDDADLGRASLVDATLHGAHAERVKMDHADLRKLRASEKTYLREGSFLHCKAAGSHWAEADLGRADLSFSDLERADFTGAQLAGAKLNGCNLSQASFQAATLVGAAIVKSNAFEASFQGADLTGADLRGSSLFGAQLWRARTDRVQLELTDVGRTHLERS